MIQSLQDKVLSELKKNKKYTNIFLTTGMSIRDVFIVDFDKYTILVQGLSSEGGKTMLMYKNVISTIIIPNQHTNKIAYKNRRDDHELD